MVTTTYQDIIDIYSPPSEIQTPKATYPVVITCRDAKKRCNPRDPRSVVAYLIKSKTLLHNETMAPIVMCPESFAAFKPTPDPCNKNSLPQDGQHRGASQALILLHELIHIDYISGPSLKFIGDHGHGSYGATAPKNKVNTNGDMDEYLVQVNPTDNDDNYATMAAWAWMQHEQRHRCPNNYPLWNEVARLGSQGMSQLRTLLAEGDGEPGTKVLTDQELKDFVNGVGRPEDTAECDATCIPYT